ncbi:hypothetical protein DRE_07368 [Drechslerella stenobrocha 248]|uniref:Uncharacterized protein n=1 Tax=Drechslerella stenobrocha 248 TaxID=1043628 RepID=W7I4U0_9PEZI|nr:hypothetical protein DRE_07368 [Drechslerella stenobrocha 248]
MASDSCSLPFRNPVAQINGGLESQIPIVKPRWKPESESTGAGGYNRLPKA